MEAQAQEGLDSRHSVNVLADSSRSNDGREEENNDHFRSRSDCHEDLELMSFYENRPVGDSNRS